MHAGSACDPPCTAPTSRVMHLCGTVNDATVPLLRWAHAMPATSISQPQHISSAQRHQTMPAMAANSACFYLCLLKHSLRCCIARRVGVCKQLLACGCGACSNSPCQCICRLLAGRQYQQVQTASSRAKFVCTCHFHGQATLQRRPVLAWGDQHSALQRPPVQPAPPLPLCAHRRRISSSAFVARGSGPSAERVVQQLQSVPCRASRASSAMTLDPKMRRSSSSPFSSFVATASSGGLLSTAAFAAVLRTCMRTKCFTKQQLRACASVSIPAQMTQHACTHTCPGAMSMSLSSWSRSASSSTPFFPALAPFVPPPLLPAAALPPFCLP